MGAASPRGCRRTCFLVEDDPVQAAKATALIEQAISENTMLFISDVVLCETV
jgi:predicted nucleic-acid-binding protein